jgi:hypothetical protein
MEVASGTCHSLAQATDGTFYCWGGNDHNQLLGEELYILTPRKLKLNFSNPVVSFGCGRNHTFLVTRGGKLFLFGDAREGQMGRGPGVNDTFSSLEPFLDWEVLIPTGGQWVWLKWMFMGRVDKGAAFYGIPVEVIFHFVTVF